MKKLTLALILGLGLQMVPASLFAATNSGPGGFVMLAVVTDGFGTWSKKDQSKASQKEFTVLNKSSDYEKLVKQAAAGKLNTLEIIK